MEIKDVFGNTIQVTDLNKAISQTKYFKELSQVNHLDFERNGKKFTSLEFYSFILTQLEKLLFAKHFEQAKREILADIKSGKIPATITSYYDLDSYVDSNCYAGFCDENYQISENFEFEIKIQEALEKWLQQRRKRLKL